MGVSDVRQLFDEISLHARKREHAVLLKAYHLQDTELDSGDGSLALAEALVRSTQVLHANLASHDLTFLDRLPTCRFCGSTVCPTTLGPFARGEIPSSALLDLMRGEFQQVI